MANATTENIEAAFVQYSICEIKARAAPAYQNVYVKNPGPFHSTLKRDIVKPCSDDAIDALWR